MKTTFEGQHEGEYVILWVEKHWVKYMRIFAIVLAAGFLPGGIAYLSVLWFFPAGLDLILSFLLLYELFILLYAFIELINDELDIFIITNERIIDIVQVSLLERRVADTPLERIQDVSADAKGWLATLFNFGTVTVQTAGKNAKFDMTLIPDPFNTSKKIMAIMNTSTSLNPPDA